MAESGQGPFRIAGGSPVATRGGIDAEGVKAARERVDRMVRSAEVFLFIKGTPARPMCGFSANTVAIMDAVGVPYRTFDVLSDDAVRAAAKEYAGWPTFPQLYVRGEFVGGNDILSEMYTTGELGELLAGGGR
jgi:monothiol glutaredoxin